MQVEGSRELLPIASEDGAFGGGMEGFDSRFMDEVVSLPVRRCGKRRLVEGEETGNSST